MILVCKLVRVLAAVQVVCGDADEVISLYLVGVWICGVWNGHFPESENYFSEAEISRKTPEFPQKERFSPSPSRLPPIIQGEILYVHSLFGQKAFEGRGCVWGGKHGSIDLAKLC